MELATPFGVVEKVDILICYLLILTTFVASGHDEDQKSSAH